MKGAPTPNSSLYYPTAWPIGHLDSRLRGKDGWRRGMTGEGAE